MKINQSGFTLVEIAIVMVIIGLLLGGVLKGQEVITNARIKSIVNDFNSSSAAIFSYQDRYKALPGDDSSASVNFPGVVSGAENGNGNGVIGGGFNSTNNAQESRLIWKHLRAAGLITGSTNNPQTVVQPTHAYGARLGVNFNLHRLSGHAICFEDMVGDIARLIDIQNDDGVANSGSVQGHNTQTAYLDADVYNVCFRI